MKLPFVLAPLLLLAAPAGAQVVPSYGPNVTLEQARRVAAAADAEATRNGWKVAVAVVDTAGNLVYFQRADDTMSASMRLAVEKAVTAATFRRPSKFFAEAIGQGGERVSILSLGAIASDGGLPIVVGGRCVGGVGVSGATSAQDGQAAAAAGAVFK